VINCSLVLFLTYLTLGLASLWSIAAVYVDCRVSWLRMPAAVLLAALLFGLLLRRKKAWCLGGILVVMAWWFTLRPSNDRPWQPDVAETSWAEIDGNRVTIHNIRNFEYRTETDYAPHWETRAFDLTQMRGIDLFITYWGSPWIAHPIVSFDFDHDRPIAFSIEVRKEIGEGYSALLGFFRQFELIYIVADERDVIRLRTNYRQGEESYLFRTSTTPERARAIFLDYLRRVNYLHEKPEWYNAMTDNCTTGIRVHAAATAKGRPAPWDWRILVNGRMDELLYQRGAFASKLPLAELKELGHVNAAAHLADTAADFSRRIREGKPGF
jgi:hypothetical protein